MASAVPAPPLTVWVGPMRYVFAPGRDVLVGHGQGIDIPLEPAGNPAPPPPRPDVVLRFTGSHWVAIDSSPRGMYVNGARVSTVDIRSGQAITIGDPQRGPRLVFQIGPAAGPPAPPGPPPRSLYPPAPQLPHPPPPAPQVPRFRPQPNRPNDLNLQAPTARSTQPIPIPAPQPPAPEPPSQPAPPPAAPRAAPLIPPFPHAQPPAPPPAEPPAPPPPAPQAPAPEPDQPPPPPAEPPPPVAQDEEPKGSGLIERMITRKFRTPGASFRTQEPNSTFRLPLRSGARTSGVVAYRLGLTVDGREVLSDISLTAGLGTLTAVVGPSAARNAALLELLAGTRALSSGQTTVDGHDVHAEPESMRTRIGIVARDERLHPRLTVAQALGYAAELRLPPDTAAEHRHRVVDQVLDEVDLTPHRATRISRLAPELRRCVSLAVELITRPTLLVVDEPGAGLDLAQQDHVMAILRRQANIGCVVVVAMSSLAALSNLNLCDQVLVLTARGATAFVGTPLQVESTMGTTDWAKVLERVGADPDGAHRAFQARQLAPPSPPEVAAPWPVPAQLTAQRQLRLLVRRQLRLLFADRIYFLFLAILPFVLAALTLLIPGDSGLERPAPSSPNAHEAIEILAALNIAAVIVGTALTIRALVEERRVFRREQAVGLSAPAYLTAKIVVLGLAAIVLAAVFFAIVIAVKGGPVHGATVLGDATVELYVSVAVTALVSAVVGLALSAMGSRQREVLPLLVPVILASALFSGSLVQLVSKWGFQQVSWFVPAQWGFAASASTVDLRRVDALAANALMWTHYSGWWVFDMVMLLGFGVVAAGFALYRLRPPNREVQRQPLHREQQELGDLAG